VRNHRIPCGAAFGAAFGTALGGAISALVVSLALACGGRTPARADSLGARGERPLATPIRGATDTATVSTPNGPVVLRDDSAPGSIAVSSNRLHWTPDVVVERLTSFGLDARAVGEVRQPFFDLAGTRVEVARGRAEVQAFVLGDASAVLRAVAPMDTARVALRGASAAWPMPATLVMDNNLAAIVLTRSAALRDSIRYALTTHQR